MVSLPAGARILFTIVGVSIFLGPDGLVIRFTTVVWVVTMDCSTAYWPFFIALASVC